MERKGLHDVYGMIVAGFTNPYVAGFYVVGVGLLCFHLSHGVGAMFQSLGLKNDAYVTASIARPRSSRSVCSLATFQFRSPCRSGW